MNGLWDIPITSVIALTAERAVHIARGLLRAECSYAKIGPASLTISSRLTIADGGIDAEVISPESHSVPIDCIFRPGLTGFQIKSGTVFKPWTASSIRGELLDSHGNVCQEVERLFHRQGQYTLLSTGHDLTPEQRNDSRRNIISTLAEAGFAISEERINVLGASQIAEYAERYPGIASLLTTDSIQEAWTLEDWQRDEHMTNVIEVSEEQAHLIERIRSRLQGDVKHIRILGEPGLGKTRMALESLKDHGFAAYTLYVAHGSQFGQTKLFRQLLRSGRDKPLILVIDELSESELSEIWRHIKPRCGYLKIISIDHGRDDSYDDHIERLHAPRLSDETIQKILSSQVGPSHDLNRWASICEGSPRVAQAVAENLRANPSDILKPPSTVPIWTRYLHGYGGRNESAARQVDCVAQHLALFSRFGYESPVGSEAAYIAHLIEIVDPTIGWARFQEIVHELRARRVLQGSRTLFFVPKALHIYLWTQFWRHYGREFKFVQTFGAMPESLHAWFLGMFKFAGDAAASHVVKDILKPDGIFSERSALTSDKGSRLLSVLAEASPADVLRLMENTIGQWTDDELLDHSENRQIIVWALEKIAVWPTLTTRAIRLLARFAVNGNSDGPTISSDAVAGLFRIGPKEAATEATPEERLPAMRALLRSSSDADRRLGLRAIESALDSQGRGFRVVGPEHQGLRIADLWIPKTYGDWWSAKLLYFRTLVDETRNWPAALEREVRLSLLNAVEQQLYTPPCTELALEVLSALVNDAALPPERLNGFFSHWRSNLRDGKRPDIAKRVLRLERRYTQRDLASRFRRYVIDISWEELDQKFQEEQNLPRYRGRFLASALAHRIARHPAHLDQVEHLLAPTTSTVALWNFGTELASHDASRDLLPPLLASALKSKHYECLSGYLSVVMALDRDTYRYVVGQLLSSGPTAWLGANIAISSGYDDNLFPLCLTALKERWIGPEAFSSLRFGNNVESVRPEWIFLLLHELKEHPDKSSQILLIELLATLPFNENSMFSSDFVYSALAASIPSEDRRHWMHNRQWKKVSLKLLEWNADFAPRLLDTLLTAMGETYALSYDSSIEPLANEIVRSDPDGAWNLVSTHLEERLPKWRSDLLHWLKGGHSFSDNPKRGAIADLPLARILTWIERDPENRAALIAHAAPNTLDDVGGGRLTRELLEGYGELKGVTSGISATFHSGGWSGPTSAHYRQKREGFRRWLASDFDAKVVRWIECEIELLDRQIEEEEVIEERDRFD